MNAARRHKEQTLARLAAEASGTESVEEVAGASTGAADFNDLMLAKLTSDRARLKEIASVERKIMAKIQMLPDYEAWLVGTMQAADSLPEGEPNDVLTTLMLWHFDCGLFDAGLDIAEVVLARAIPLPSWMQRTPAAAIAEEVAEASFKAVREKQTFDRLVIGRAMELTSDADIHDEVRAKLHKAEAQLIDRLIAELDAAGPDPDDIPGGDLALADEGLQHANRALELNPNSGVKALIARFEKRLKTEPA